MQSRSIYKKKLKLPPKYNYHISDYFIKEWFFEAEKSYLQNYVRIKS